MTIDQAALRLDRWFGTNHAALAIQAARRGEFDPIRTFGLNPTAKVLRESGMTIEQWIIDAVGRHGE